MMGGRKNRSFGLYLDRDGPGNSELDVDTFIGDGQLAGLGDLDRLHGLVAGLRLDLLNLLDDVVALENLAEDDVAAVEPPATDS